MKEISMKKTILISTLLAALTFTGCTDSTSSLTPPKNTAQHSAAYDNASDTKREAFENKKQKVGHSTKQDPKYKSFRPVLTTTENKTWFNNQMYLLWDRQITRSQYVSQGVAKFPSYKYEFTFIANQF
jgi:hypothetical protein